MLCLFGIGQFIVCNRTVLEQGLVKLLQGDVRVLASLVIS
jgi:hypothetical protein